MTEKQKADYLKDPTRCPYCGDEEFFCNVNSMSGLEIQCECRDCGRSWVEVLQRVDVREPQPSTIKPRFGA